MLALNEQYPFLDFLICQIKYIIKQLLKLLLMSDKYKFLYNGGNIGSPTQQTNLLRSSFQPTTSSNFQGFNFNNSNSNITTEMLKQSGSEMVSPRQKNNYSTNIKQLQSKFQNGFSQLKKEQGNKIQSNDLRISLSNNVKKIDKDYFRKTAFSPKPFIMFPQKTIEPKSNQSNHQSEQKSSNLGNNQNLFKKNNQINQSERNIIPQIQINNYKTKPLINLHNKGLLSPQQSTSPYQQQQRKSLQKKSPIICGFYLGRSLGAGKFGEVYLAKHVVTGFVCAIKKIVKAKVKEHNMINQLIQQIKIHAFLVHPNIVQFYGCVVDQLNIYILLEYMQGGTLFDYMTEKDILSEQQSVIYLREISQAIKYMHDKDIAHRDIKPENIVMSYNIVKLCDFGWAAKVAGARKTYCGTFDYAPPEILERKQYDQSVDMWCLGILTYEMLTGKVPFQHKQRKMVMQKIVNVDKDKIIFPQSMSKLAKEFIENLIKKNPSQRLKSYRLLQHPFLKKKEQ